jgi:hypothetical protein
LGNVFGFEHPGISDPGIGVMVLGVEDGQGEGTDEVVVCIHEHNDVIRVAVLVDPKVEVGQRPHSHHCPHKLNFVLERVVG